MNELITVLLRFLVGYDLTYYGLSTIWANRTGTLVASAIAGVLAVLFFNL